jgi:peptidoglycan/LPS O-acetylase OafA/YrhL
MWLKMSKLPPPPPPPRGELYLSDSQTDRAFDYRTNNFNLIRLFAALQVVFGHLDFAFYGPGIYDRYLSLFAGVPVFFTLSGFLIYWSFDNNPNLRNYFINRFLRIYPALICAFILSIIFLLVFHKLTVSDMTSTGFLMWTVAQLTFVQEYTPSYFGCLIHDLHMPNPPLWTISIEILLYFSIPVIYYLTRKFKKRYKTLIILFFGIISYIQNQTDFLTDFVRSLSNNEFYLIFIWPFSQFTSFFWYFSLGFIVYLYKEAIIPFLEEKAVWLISIYIALCIILYIFGYEPGNYAPAGWELVAHIVLVTLIFSVAYTKPDTTKRLIGNMDISYGIYIYHALIISVFYHLWITTPLGAVVCGIVVYGISVLSISWLSWTFIEKKALSLKKKSLYKNK